jgi:hypothetical protein
MANHYDAVELLLEKHADPNACNHLNETPLHQAADLGYIKIVEALLRYGANVDMQQNDGDTPLHLACFKGNYKIVQALIDSSANPNITNLTLGRTPLHIAVDGGHTEIVELLVSNGALPMIQDTTGKTAFDYSESSEIISILESGLQSSNIESQLPSPETKEDNIVIKTDTLSMFNPLTTDDTGGNKLSRRELDILKEEESILEISTDKKKEKEEKCKTIKVIIHTNESTKCNSAIPTQAHNSVINSNKSFAITEDYINFSKDSEIRPELISEVGKKNDYAAIIRSVNNDIPSLYSDNKPSIINKIGRNGFIQQIGSTLTRGNIDTKEFINLLNCTTEEESRCCINIPHNTQPNNCNLSKIQVYQEQDEGFIDWLKCKGCGQIVPILSAKGIMCHQDMMKIGDKIEGMLKGSCKLGYIVKLCITIAEGKMVIRKWAIKRVPSKEV